MPKPLETTQASVLSLSLIAVGIGIVTGLGAIVLRTLMGLLHNIFFLGTFSLAYDANVPTPPSPYGPFVILAPVIGGVIVVYLVKTFAPEARGHGVPEVMDAIYYKKGKIRPAVVVIKSLASALSIGSGASVGREGPIIQIGSGIGSVLGGMFHLRSWQILTLVASGAGAGIAATFNTPLGAVLFAIELMLPEFSARTLLPVVLATGSATYVGRLAFGLEPTFLVATHQRPDLFVPLSLDMLPLYVLLGLLCGLGSAVFVKFLGWAEALYDRVKLNDYVKNVIAMTGLGVLMYALLLTTGAYHTEGVGYSTIQGVLSGQISGTGFLLMLFGLKLVATVLSLGGGASGGIFSPSLFMGATLGGAFGAMLNAAFPYLSFSPITFALIGMASIVGGSTGAALTAIVMLFEMTGDYSITLAAIIAVVCAVGLRSWLSETDIYTDKLVRRGHYIPRDHRSHMFPIRLARDVAEPVIGVVERAEMKPEWQVAQDAGDRAFAVVTERGRILGVVRVLPGDVTRPLGPIMAPVGVVRESSFLQKAMTHMADRGYVAAMVTPDGKVARADRVTGVLTRYALSEAVLRDFQS